jgi:hypothetical protein
MPNFYFIFKVIPFPPVLRLKLEPSMTMHQEDPWPEELFCIYMEGKSIKLDQMNFSFRTDAGNHHMIHGRMKNRLIIPESFGQPCLIGCDLLRYPQPLFHCSICYPYPIDSSENNSSQAHQTIEHLSNHRSKSKTARAVTGEAKPYYTKETCVHEQGYKLPM